MKADISSAMSASLMENSEFCMFSIAFSVKAMVKASRFTKASGLPRCEDTV